MAKKTKSIPPETVKKIKEIKERKKNGMGAPPKYKEEFCELLIEHMSEGFSFESFAGVVGCCMKTLDNWALEYPDFLRAKAEGRQRSLFWWEKQGHKGLFSMEGVSLNPTVYRMNMINRFKWKDKAEEEKKIDLSVENLTDDQLENLIKEALKK